MLTGKVKYWADEKGYGFIAPDRGGKDIFVHFSDIESSGQGRKSLSVGQTVDYEIGDSERGPKAVKVQTGIRSG